MRIPASLCRSSSFPFPTVLPILLGFPSALFPSLHPSLPCTQLLERRMQIVGTVTQSYLQGHKWFCLRPGKRSPVVEEWNQLERHEEEIVGEVQQSSQTGTRKITLTLACLPVLTVLLKLLLSLLHSGFSVSLHLPLLPTMMWCFASFY